MTTQANQVQIPVIQTADANLVQTQINANKVFRNLNNQISDLQDFTDEMNLIGEIKIANLTVDQFQAIAGTDWILCNGQSCVNTTYSKMTGNNNVPNITLGSVNNFIKVY